MTKPNHGATAPSLLAIWSPTRGVWEDPSGQIDLFSEHSEPYSATWPSSGSMRNGEAFARPMLVPHIDASGSSFSPYLGGETPVLPTPTVSEANGPDNNTGTGEKNLRTLIRDDIVTLPTPLASLAEHRRDVGTDPERRRAQGRSVSLADEVIHGRHVTLPTPTEADARAGGGSIAANVTLTDAVVRTELGRIPNARLLPTPTAGVAGNASRGGDRKEELLLGGIARDLALFPTPTVQDGKNNAGPSQHDRNTPPLNVEVTLLPTPSAALLNDHETAEQWQERYDRHATKADNPTRAGLPLPIAVQTVDWGKYLPAIRLGEAVAGRVAPDPTNADGKGGTRRLAARFVEWMMLLPEGHVTGHGLTRSQELARLGNGVVPLQAAAATGSLIARMAESKRADLARTRS